MKIINHILDDPDDKDFDVSSMLHGSMPDIQRVVLGLLSPICHK